MSVDYLGYVRQAQQSAPAGADPVTAYAAGQNIRARNMELEERQRKLDEQQGLRAYAQEQLSIDRPNPAYAAYQDQLASIQGPVAPYQQFDGTANTGVAPETPTPEWTQAQAIYAQPEPPKNLPKPSIFQIQRDYAMQSGNAEALEKLQSHALEQALNVGKLTGNNELGVKLYNDMMGTDFKYHGTTKENFFDLSQGGKRFRFDPATGQTTLIAENPKEQSAKIIDKSIDLGDKVLIQYADGTQEERKKAARPDTVIKLDRGGQPRPAKVLPASQLEGLADASQVLKTLGEAKAISGAVSTGPLVGRAQSLGQYVGASGENFNQLKQKIATVENIMLKLRSGAAVTESEYKRFMKEMPNVNDRPEIISTKFANAERYMQELLDGKLSTYEEGGYRTPTGVQARSKPAKASKGQSGPKIGDVIDGYKFKGGNPADKSRWIKVGG